MVTVPQRKASDFRRSLAVTANAGAGKTTVLVQRFLDIVTTASAAVDEVVAITYTEKAAAELRKKIADTVAAGLREARSPSERMKYEEVRDRLAGARICTIHAFCAQLLRDNPVETGIDAAFTVLEEVDRQVLQE